MLRQLTAAAAAASFLVTAPAAAAPAFADIAQIAAPPADPALIAEVWDDAQYAAEPFAPLDVAYALAGSPAFPAQVDPALRERAGSPGVTAPAPLRTAAVATVLGLAAHPSRSMTADLALLFGLGDARSAIDIPGLRFEEIAGALYRQGVVRAPRF